MNKVIINNLKRLEPIIKLTDVDNMDFEKIKISSMYRESEIYNTHGIDVMSKLKSVLNSQLTDFILYDVLERTYNIKYINIDSVIKNIKRNNKINSLINDNDNDIIIDEVYKSNFINNLIKDELENYDCDYIICDNKLLSIIMDDDNFKSCSYISNLNHFNYITLVGNLNGKNIYCNSKASYNDNRIYLINNSTNVQVGNMEHINKNTHDGLNKMLYLEIDAKINYNYNNINIIEFEGLGKYNI